MSKASRDKSEDAKSRIGSRLDQIQRDGSNRIAAIWVVAVLALLVGQLVPKVRLWEMHVRDAHFAKEQLTGLEKEQWEGPSTYEDEVRKRESKFVESTKKLQEGVPFSLLGNSINVPVQYAPSALSTLIFCLVVHFAMRRAALLRLIAQTVRLMRIARHASDDEIRDITGPLPFWLAPLPHSAGSFVASQDMTLALGWDRSNRRNLAATYVALSAIAFLQLFVFSLSVRVDASYLFLGISCVSFAGTVLTMIHWVGKTRVEDSFRYEISKIKYGRRDVLKATASFLGAVCLPIVLTIRLAGKIALSPRYITKDLKNRRRKRRAYQVGMARGFYRNRKSNIVHFVGAKGTVANAFGLQPGNLERVDIPVTTEVGDEANVGQETNSIESSDAIHPRLQLSTACRSIELVARQFIEAKDYAEARRVLRIGVKYDRLGEGRFPFPVRIYDLLAGLTVRFAPDEFDEFIEFINETPGNEELTRRIAKWVNIEGKWRKRWTDKGTRISWAGLLM